MRKFPPLKTFLNKKDYGENNVFYELEQLKNTRKREVNHRLYKKIKKQLAGCSMIVLRVDASGRLTESKPCLDCTKHLKLLGIKHVFYSSFGGNIISEKIKDLQTSHLCRSRKAMKNK